MKILPTSGLAAGVALLSFANGCATAQPTLTNATAPQGTSPNMATPVTAANLDNAAFAEWENGTEKALSQDKSHSPAWVIWNDNNPVGLNGMVYGDSKRPGKRHLRLGFKQPIAVGSILVRGGGTLSVLKPTAAYPGALDDDSQWIPAQRLVNGSPSSAELSDEDEAIWVLPPGTKTQALRFTHTAQPAEVRYGGFLRGVFVMSDRVANLAPLAVAGASSNNQKAGQVNNGSEDGWGAWDNGATDASPLITQKPEQITLVWPAPVRLNGLLTTWAGFGSAEVQTYNGPADRHPRDAAEADWQSVQSYAGLKNGYPLAMWPNRLDFGRTITTRAIRLRLTSTTNEGHPHLNNRTKNGRFVWLGELMALQPLDEAPLQAVKFVPVNASPANPPIPIRFTLAKPGYVTLVIEGLSGKRVRNLVSETYFPAGENTAWWDGTDDLGRDVDAARHGLYKIPAQFVVPGAYKVRGLVRDALDLRYEFSVYNAGNPAWPTPDGTGAWLSNHTPSQAALFLPAEQSPAGKAMVYLGSYVSEGRDGLAWVDLDGHKLGGKRWLGGIWTGAAFLTRDAGANRIDTNVAYAGAAFEGELRLTTLLRDGSDKAVFKTNWKFPGANDAESKANTEMGGVAAYNGILASSLTKIGQILFVDAKTGEVKGAANIASPRGLIYDAQGRLFVLSGNKLVRFDSTANPAQLPALQTVIDSNLQDPSGITLDSKGNFYISDRGTSHQVKIFDPTGKFIRAIGKAGAPKAGAYDPLHMNNPQGLTLDSQNRIWVTENDYLPRRVSIWTQTGEFVKAFYGPSKYGGGGKLDDGNKNRFYYGEEGKGTLEFKLDWTKGTTELSNVVYRPGDNDIKLPERTAAPETAFQVQGRQYLTNCYNSNPVGGAAVAFIFQQTGASARPVAAAGRANDWDVLKTDAFKASWPQGVDLKGDVWRNNGQNQAFFLWSDANGDAQVQPTEVTMQQSTVGGVTVMSDLSFCVARLNNNAVRFAPTSFTAKGAPSYDVTKIEILAKDVQGPGSSGGDQVLYGAGGNTIATLGIKPFHQLSLSGAKGGVPMWSYPSPWPGLHASHEAAKPDRPGQVIGSTRLLGGFVTPKNSDAGQLWAVNGNMGNMYLFTSDGLFVATLFKDVRQGKLWQMPIAQRNMKLENITLHDENFWPTLSQTPDGQVYLIDGANTSLVRVDGLESIKRIPEMTLRVSADDLQKAQTYLVAAEADRQKTQGRGILEAAIRGNAPTVDGNLDDWANASWVDIDKSGVGANFNSESKPYDITASVAISGDRLYAAWRTANPRLLENSGEMATAPFKTGGALDIMLATDPKADPKRANPVAGDIRFLVTQVKGKPMALVYRAVVPGTKTPVPFSSPWRTITLDKVDDVSSQVQLAGDKGNYEISIPLEALGLKAIDGIALQGDIGILRGDGAQTTARTYWSNKATGITADVPSEAQLTPNLWGQWQFKAAP